MLRLAGLRLSPLLRVVVGVTLALIGFAMSAPLLMLVGGGLTIAAIIGSIAPTEREDDARDPG